jgi:hypothetical protein
MVESKETLKVPSKSDYVSAAAGFKTKKIKEVEGLLSSFPKIKDYIKLKKKKIEAQALRVTKALKTAEDVRDALEEQKINADKAENTPKAFGERVTEGVAKMTKELQNQYESMRKKAGDSEKAFLELTNRFDKKLNDKVGSVVNENKVLREENENLVTSLGQTKNELHQANEKLYELSNINQDSGPKI